MSESSAYRSDCPVASALDVVGDRWTLLILRDMIFGAATFGDFTAAAEGIPTNVLTARLQRMEAQGLVRREAYQQRPARYRYLLTARGADLLPVVQALAQWGGAHLPHAYAPPDTLLQMQSADLTAGTPQA